VNKKFYLLFKNVSYSIFSNFVFLLISSLVVLIVPKIIGVKEYGYWQIYLFYSAYIGFLHLGWSDGIYLRYGGIKYKELDKSLFQSQFWSLVIFQLLVAIAVYGTSFFLIDPNKQYIFKLLSVAIVLKNSKSFLLYVLQGTNRIKHYAVVTIFDRLIYAFFVIGFLLIGKVQFKFLLYGDIGGKLMSLIYATLLCKDMVFKKLTSFYFSFKETVSNINVGSKLMLANIASILLVGIIRFGIERTWDVETFGKVSLILSISSFMMLFISAISIVLFPILRRIEPRKLYEIYLNAREIIMTIFLALLLVYFPMKHILINWLPKYADSLIYMAIIFPIFIFEGKTILLINTYYKTMRKEKKLLKVNIISLSISAVLTFTFCYLFPDLNMAMGSLIIATAARCIISELELMKILEISIIGDVLLETFIIAVFIIIGVVIQSLYAVFVYMMVYATYLVVKKKKISYSIKWLKKVSG